MSAHDLAALAAEEYAYLTTTGRVTGDPHEIEIWFSTDGECVHLLSGGGASADWVQNLRADPRATVRIAGESHSYRARFHLPDDECAAVAARHAAKYRPDAATRWADGYLLALEPAG